MNQVDIKHKNNSYINSHIYHSIWNFVWNNIKNIVDNCVWYSIRNPICDLTRQYMWSFKAKHINKKSIVIILEEIYK